MRRVQANKIYRYDPVGMDIYDLSKRCRARAACESRSTAWLS